MKYFSLLILAFCFALPLEAKIEWQTDYKEVRSVCQKENKHILLFFNGSDWAGAAMKMRHEILNSAAFQEKIASKFICMEVDFPKHTLLAQGLAIQNMELKNRFKVQDFPALLLLDIHERVIARVDYFPESGEMLANDLLKIVDQDAELLFNLKNLKTLTIVQLKRLYQLAQELNNNCAIEQIIDIGLKKEDPFFCLERYRFLVEKGEIKTEEALLLRQKLVEFGPEGDLINGQGIPFTLALIDFQELSQKNYAPDIVTQPLIDYLARFAEKDQKNIWRIEMMIAETYLDADQWQEALKHAEEAYRTAPETMHEEIAHSLDYIRLQSTTR